MPRLRIKNGPLKERTIDVEDEPLTIGRDPQCAIQIMDKGASRQHADIATGLSPRAGLALLQAARAHALLRNRSHVLPDDIQAVFVALAGHRLVAAGGEHSGQALAQMLLARVAVD